MGDASPSLAELAPRLSGRYRSVTEALEAYSKPFVVVWTVMGWSGPVRFLSVADADVTVPSA